MVHLESIFGTFMVIIRWPDQTRPIPGDFPIFIPDSRWTLLSACTGILPIWLISPLDRSRISADADQGGRATKAAKLPRAKANTNTENAKT